MKHQIKFKDVYLDVTGTYDKGSFGTYEQEPGPEEFTIDKVEIHGTDITELVEDYINDLEIEVIKNHYR